MSKKQDLNNLKQQINMVSNFAKNLQFQSKLKKPTSLLNRNEREYAKNSLAPSPSQFVSHTSINITFLATKWGKEEIKQCHVEWLDHLDGFKQLAQAREAETAAARGPSRGPAIFFPVSGWDEDGL